MNAATTLLEIPVFDPFARPANDDAGARLDWLELRALSARVLERVELLDGVPHYTAEVRLACEDHEEPRWRLAVTLAVPTREGTSELLRASARAWLRARGVRRCVWVRARGGLWSRGKKPR